MVKMGGYRNWQITDLSGFLLNITRSDFGNVMIVGPSVRMVLAQLYIMYIKGT